MNQELDFVDDENLEVAENFDPIHEDNSLIKEPKTPPRRNYKDLISKLTDGVPNGKNVKIMKLTKQPDGKLQCQLCENIFDGMNEVVKHQPNCAKLDSAKGQLISEQIYAILNFPKMQRNIARISALAQSYIYQVLQTIQMKLILLCVWAEPAVLGSAKTALKFKYEI